MKYYLAEACQNTFVLFDCLHVSQVNGEFLSLAHDCLKRESRDDVLILVNGRIEKGAYYARMVVLGLDGALGEFCGNGARACAAYLFDRFSQIGRIFLESPWGIHPLERHGENMYSIKLPSASFDWNPKFIVDLEQCELDYVEMIEPHLIIAEEMSEEELLSVGRALNQRRELFPRGINVNAYHFLEDGALYVKTYERGVQRLTKSCGSGSIACVAHSQIKGCKQIVTAGGALEITIQEEGVVLKGPAFFFDSDRRERGG